MKKIFLILFVASFFVLSGKAMALISTPSASRSTNVEASVGKLVLNLSGLSSPNASIVLDSDKTFLRSGLADKGGLFSFKDVPIKEGFSNFCLAAVDFKKVGDTKTCFNIPPAHSNVTKTNIFLPPTIGVSGRRLTPGSSIYAFGYTMPDAWVTLHVGPGIELKIKAGNDGLYRVEVKDLPVGKYSLFATATYKNLNSEKPDKSIEIESVSQGQAIKEGLLDLLKRFIKTLLTFITRYFWLAIPILILIIILLSKKLRNAIRKILKRAEDSLEGPRKPGKLHHEWFIGY